MVDNTSSMMWTSHGDTFFYSCLKTETRAKFLSVVAPHNNHFSNADIKKMINFAIANNERLNIL